MYSNPSTPGGKQLPTSNTTTGAGTHHTQNVTNNINVNTNATAGRIASELGWALRQKTG